MSITVRYSSVDGFRESKTFGDLGEARAYAQCRIGETPEMGSSYAVSDDGIGKITVEGTPLASLFPRLQGD